GSGTPGNPSGVRNSTVTPRARALCASEVKVRTTPFTCGCQASVAIRTRIKPLALRTADPSHYRIACDKIAILISQQCDDVTCASVTLAKAQRPASNFRARSPPFVTMMLQTNGTLLR